MPVLLWRGILASMNGAPVRLSGTPFVAESKRLCDGIALKTQPQDNKAPMIVWEKTHNR